MYHTNVFLYRMMSKKSKLEMISKVKREKVENIFRKEVKFCP